MEAHDGDGTVAVTGGTGYLAGWVITGLLARGYRVRATVRDLSKAPLVCAAVRREVGSAAAGSLELLEADLLHDDGWDAALRGADYVVHTASPMPFDRDADLIKTAREGTRRVLAAAARAGVRRTVLTSSGVTAVPDDPEVVATEAVQSAPSGDRAHAYPDSKILAERDAWEFAAAAGLDLCAVLPTFMQGTVLGAADRSGTIDVVRRLLEGKLPALPNIGWNVVDVRDVAQLHILAMTSPFASGQRFLGAGTFLWYTDIARILRDGLGEDADRVPMRRMPDFAVKVLARFDSQVAMVRSELGLTRLVDSSKAREVLGWQTRDVERTILDTAASLLSKDPSQ
jgi:nucleoside-diphosphate-sugar epimerase